MRLDDGVTVSMPIEPEDLPHYQAYVMAHELLPPLYPRSMDHVQELAPKAYRILSDPHHEEGVLEAIMLLGHTPTRRALDTLRGYARSGRPHAVLAKIAALECETLPRLT